MSFIPKNAKWYLADIVEEVRVKGDRRNVIHINQVLVRANSPEEAYEKSLQLGQRSNITYRNEEGKKVSIRFRGLGELQVIYEDLKHGSELSCRREGGVSEKRIKNWIASKRSLSVFAPIQAPSGPNYADSKIVREISKRLSREKARATLRDQKKSKSREP